MQATVVQVHQHEPIKTGSFVWTTSSRKSLITRVVAKEIWMFSSASMDWRSCQSLLGLSQSNLKKAFEKSHHVHQCGEARGASSPSCSPLLTGSMSAYIIVMRDMNRPNSINPTLRLFGVFDHPATVRQLRPRDRHRASGCTCTSRT